MLVSNLAERRSAGQPRSAVPTRLLKTTFCRGEILREGRIGGRAIRHSLSCWGLCWLLERPLQRRRTPRLMPNLPERDELPRHCRVHRGRCRPSTTCLRRRGARSWRHGPGRFYGRAIRPDETGIPGSRARDRRTPQPCVFSTRVCPASENVTAGSRLVIRSGIWARIRVLRLPESIGSAADCSLEAIMRTF